jgi:type IV conjugative transfer system coupling protein TraD
MSKNFVRGGQLSLHSLRMLRQVFASLSIWGMWLTGLIVSYYCFLCISLYQCKVMLWYGLAHIFIALKKPFHQIGIQDEYGEQILVSAYDFAASYLALSTKYYLIDVLIESLIMAGVILGVILVVIIIYFFWRGRQISNDEELRGNKLIDVDQLKKAIYKDNKKQGYKSYTLGSIPYPAHTETTHTLIAGNPSSGKTVLISNLINEIKKRGDRAIIYDKMGVYTERFYQPGKDIILNPFDQRSSNWNIFKEVRTEAHFDSIAAALIPQNKGGTDPFWVDAARTLFSAVCGSLLKKGGVSNAELIETLLRKTLNEAAALVKGTAAQAIIDENSPKTALSVMATMSTYLKCLTFLRDVGEPFSIRDWVRGDNNDCVFITSTGDLHAALSPLISAWIEIAINNMLSLSQSRTRKIWVILDELPSLHALPSLEQGLAETRQFGGCFVLSIQSISQLRSKYNTNSAQTISSLCNTKVFLRAGDSDSAKWYSDNIGIIEVEEMREGLSYGAHEMRDGINVNRQKIMKHLVLPTELINLKDREGYFCMGKNYPVAKASFDYTDWKIKNPKVVEIKEQKAPSKPIVSVAAIQAPQAVDENRDASTYSEVNSGIDVVNDNADTIEPQGENTTQGYLVAEPVETSDTKPAVSKTEEESTDKDFDQI